MCQNELKQENIYTTLNLRAVSEILSMIKIILNELFEPLLKDPNFPIQLILRNIPESLGILSN